MLDKKEQQMIDYLYKKIENDSFIEEDIYLLLILLRRHSKPNSPVREFADFVAHREKDRGFIHRYIKTTKSKFDKLFKEKMQIEIKEVFTSKEIMNSFNETFSKIRKEKISLQKTDDIIFCIIILLQDVKLTDKNNKYMGKLAFSMSKNNISLNGRILQTYDGKEINVEFPVLSIKNRYFSIEVKPNESSDSHGQMFGILNCRREDGKLTLEADMNYLLIP